MRKWIVALSVLSLAGMSVTLGYEVPRYTMERREELKKQVLDTKYDTYCALLKLASDDPAEAAEGAKMMVHRIEVGRSGIAFFNIDIVLGYRLFKDRFSPGGRKTVEKWILDSIKPGSWHYGNRFVHANDNWPFVTCYMMIIGGEAIGRNDLVQEAIVRLETYLDICRQLGLGSEYNSPTYNPLSLSCVEAVAGLSQSLRARVVARVIAERLWSEIALHYHAPSSQFAAPQSRAYMHDTLCIGSALRYTLYPLLPGGVLLDRESFPEMKVHLQSVAEESLLRHFLDPRLAAICEHKQFPYLLQARKYRPFRSEGPDSWPGGFFDTVTYMTGRYAVGSTQRTYAGGNGTTPFQVHWTKVPRATKPGDAHTLYTRYRMNDAQPVLEGVFPEQGYIHPLQYRNTTIVLYRPRLALNSKMKTLCASALVPLPRQLDSLYVGYPPKKVKALPVSLKKPASVFIQDGDVYVALHPLAVTDRGRKEALRLEEASRHLIVSYYNLQSESETSWDESEFLATRNGFVVEVGDAKEYGSFDGFVRTVGHPTLEDTLEDGIRTVSYSRQGRTMLVKQRVATHQYLARTYDGKEYVGPMLRSPYIVASLGETVTVGDATLTSRAGEPKWLCAEPTTGSYVVLYPFRWTHPLHLKTPKGELECEGFRMGRILYRPGAHTRLVIDCERAPRPLRFTKPGGPFTVILNDEDVTGRVKAVENGWLEVALPGNDRPDAMHGVLEVKVEQQFAALKDGKGGGLSASVRNLGGSPALSIVASPYIQGFARRIGRQDRFLPELAPGALANLQWPVKGSTLGVHARAKVVVTAENAPTAVAEARR